ncbi:Lrp/AsnC family transcriptional regulator [Henriciella litoralis]|uniref:Lrp/AsnC family transcriptional regulator n=1 Tax=Henriciella litoralis TaxID=568102 RepID=UPI000A002D55|nr:Lrp/AsnC family transcriptional regulator [Henriciella litoralis]
MDALDSRIIAELKKDGRQSAQSVANAVGSSAVTVRSRIKELEDSGMLKVVAVTDFSAAGYDTLLAVGVDVERRTAEDVALELSQYEQILAVNLISGATDIEILVGARDFADVSRFLEEEIGRIKGIGKLSAALALEVFKYESETVVDT